MCGRQGGQLERQPASPQVAGTTERVLCADDGAAAEQAMTEERAPSAADASKAGKAGADSAVCA